MSKEREIYEQKFPDILNENYARRIEEVDAFCKRFSNMCGEVNTEFLYGWLNLVQHYVDMQKTYKNPYIGNFTPQIMTDMIKKNTEGWIQTVHNIDTAAIDTMKNLKNNLRAINNGSIVCIQSIERCYKLLENTKQNKKNELKLEKPEKQLESVVELKKIKKE